MTKTEKILQLLDLCLSNQESFITELQIIKEFNCHRKTARRLITTLRNKSDFLKHFKIEFKEDHSQFFKYGEIWQIRIKYC